MTDQPMAESSLTTNTLKNNTPHENYFIPSTSVSLKTMNSTANSANGNLHLELNLLRKTKKGRSN